MDEVAKFIASYTSADEEWICFDWNGKHAEEFVDFNMEFRHQVRKAVLVDVSAAPLELVRDLFRAETQCSREVWGIVRGVGQLAENLLRRGGETYLDDFLDGKYQSFDATLGSSFEADLPLAEAMLDVVRRRLQSNPDSPHAGKWRVGEELFLDWVRHCNR